MKTNEQSKITVSKKEYEEAMKAWDSIPSLEEASKLLVPEEMEELSKLPSVRTYMDSFIKAYFETQKELIKSLEAHTKALDQLIKVREELNQANKVLMTVEFIMDMTEDEVNRVIH